MQMIVPAKHLDAHSNMELSASKSDKLWPVALRWLFYNWHVARYFLFLAPEPKAPEPPSTLRAYLFEIIESESEPRFQILVRTLCIPPLSLDLSLSYRGRCWLSDICITPPAKLSGHPYQGGASASLVLWVLSSNGTAGVCLIRTPGLVLRPGAIRKSGRRRAGWGGLPANSQRQPR